MRGHVRSVLSAQPNKTNRGSCVCTKSCARPFLFFTVQIEMQGKNFLIFGIISFLILVGVIYSAVRRPQAASTQTKLTEEVLEEETLVESSEEEKPVQQEQANLKQYEEAPVLSLKEGVDYKARIKTNMGEILVDLFEDKSPITVNNFVFLANDGFYDGVIFHRIIKEFMIQGGDPLGLGVGGPGYQFGDEFNDVPLVEGSLAMANSGPNTNGSQFFIVTVPETPWLDGKHTNFGQIIEGLDVVSAIEAVDIGANDKPLEDVVIESIEIIEE